MKIFVILSIFAWLEVASARLAEKWDYEKLANRADVILIATPVNVDESKEFETVPEMFIENTVPLKANVSLAAFAVQTVLKGDSVDDNIVLRFLRIPKDHYLESQMGAFYVNGPWFVSFEPNNGDSYLMFLTRLASGQYISISGQTDPVYGIIRLDETLKAENAAGQPATRPLSK